MQKPSPQPFVSVPGALAVSTTAFMEPQLPVLLLYGLHGPRNPFLSHWICFNFLTMTCKLLQSLVAFLLPCSLLSKHISNMSGPVQESMVQLHRWKDENKQTHKKPLKRVLIKENATENSLESNQFGLLPCHLFQP